MTRTITIKEVEKYKRKKIANVFLKNFKGGFENE